MVKEEAAAVTLLDEKLQAEGSYCGLGDPLQSLFLVDSMQVRVV